MKFLLLIRLLFILIVRIIRNWISCFLKDFLQTVSLSLFGILYVLCIFSFVIEVRALPYAFNKINKTVEISEATTKDG